VHLSRYYLWHDSQVLGGDAQASAIAAVEIRQITGLLSAFRHTEAYLIISVLEVDGNLHGSGTGWHNCLGHEPVLEECLKVLSANKLWAKKLKVASRSRSE